jgi:hypothetical protein
MRSLTALSLLFAAVLLKTGGGALTDPDSTRRRLRNDCLLSAAASFCLGTDGSSNVLC